MARGRPNGNGRMPRRKLLTRDTAFLNRIGSRDTVMSSMRTAAADQSVTYKRLRTQMEGALNRLTHTLTEKKGVLLMRTADGKLDNPYGGPACLMPNGQAAWALSGQRMDQKR